MVKKSKTPTPSEPNPGHPGLRAGRWGRVDRALRWPALGGAAVAVKSLALIWGLARTGFLTVRGSAAGRGVGGGGVDLGISADGFFDHTGSKE